MSDFEFFGTWEDGLEVIDLVINLRKYKLIPNIPYKDNNIVEIKSVNEIQNDFDRTVRSIYLWSDEYSKFPVKLSKPNKNNNCMIEQLESGPLLRIHIPQEYQHDKYFLVGRGDLYHDPYYLYPGTLTRYSPPDELRKAYSQLKRVIQKLMVKRLWKPYIDSLVEKNRGVVEEVWIGKRGYELLRNNDYHLQFGNNSWFSYSSLFE